MCAVDFSFNNHKKMNWIMLALLGKSEDEGAFAFCSFSKMKNQILVVKSLSNCDQILIFLQPHSGNWYQS